MIEQYVYYETKLGKLLCGDALEILPRLERESVDIVVTDPPYNSQAIVWDKKDDEWQLVWLTEIKQILKDGGVLYVFFAPLNMFKVVEFIRGNFTLKNLLVWYHTNLFGSGLSYGSDRWKSTWDVIIYATKGKRSKCKKNVSQCGYLRWGRGFDVFEYPQPRPLLHKAQKPLELITKLVDCSSEQGDLVLDPFGGSGTTAIAAEFLKRRWLLIEKEEHFCKLIVERLKNWKDEVKKIEFLMTNRF